MRPGGLASSAEQFIYSEAKQLTSLSIVAYLSTPSTNTFYTSKMADKAPTVVATSQSNNASKKALRHAKKAKKKATETAASQSESRAETAIDLDEKVDIYAIEKRIHEKAAQRVADQKAYWNLLVEEFKADDPNYGKCDVFLNLVESLLMVHVVEFQPVWSDSEEIDRLMNYWTE